MVRQGVGALAFSVFLFFSCSPDVSTSVSGEDDTLRGRSQSLEQSVPWTAELEGSVLAENAESGLPAGDEMPLALAFSSGAESERPVYPRLAGGFSLDVSSMDSGALEAVEGFLSAMQDGNSLEPFIENGMMYTLALFLHDFAQAYGNAAVYDYAAGEPFFSEGTYQCPARLFLRSGSGGKSAADVYLFLRNAGSGWKIVQLELF